LILKFFLISLSLISMFAMGLQITKKKDDLDLKRFAFLVLGLNYLILPCLAFYLTWALELTEEFRMAILLCAISPGGTSGAIFVIRSNGNPFIGGLMILGLNTIGSVLIPIIVYLSLNAVVAIPLSLIGKIFLFGLGIQAFPLMLGIWFRKYLKLNHSSISKALSQVANLILFISILLITIDNYSALLNLEWEIIFVIILLAVFASNSGFLFFKYPLDIQSSISAVTGIRNLTIAFLLVEFLWKDTTISIGIMLYGAIMYIVAYFSTNLWKSKVKYADNFDE